MAASTVCPKGSLGHVYRWGKGQLLSVKEEMLPPKREIPLTKMGHVPSSTVAGQLDQQGRVQEEGLAAGPSPRAPPQGHPPATASSGWPRAGVLKAGAQKNYRESSLKIVIKT